jgi:Electron transfer DM13
MSKKLMFWIGIVLVILLASGGFYLYTSRLAQSKKEGEKIVSRAVDVPAKTEKAALALDGVSKTAESVPMSKMTKIRSGEFVTLDPLHYAKGSVYVSESNDKVRVDFSANFETNPDGPDFYVWLVKNQEIKNIAIGGVSSSEGDYIDLGPLSKKSGAQSYQVTRDEYMKNDYAVVIWCRAFSVQFSNAVLK